MVVTVKTRLYTATVQEIDGLAAECYGKILQADGLSDAIDFSFAGPNGTENGEIFQILLDSTFRKPAKRKKSAQG